MTFLLSGKQRRFLRALGHALKPVVHVGHAGLTEPVMKAIDQALETHELIKIKVAAEAGDGADALVEPLERVARTAVAQVVGKTLLVYRGRKKEPAIVLPDEHQAGSVNAAAKAEKPARQGRHLAKSRQGKRGSNLNRSESTPRMDANRRAEGSRREGKSRREASLRRAEPAGRAEPSGRTGRAEPGRTEPAGRTGRAEPAGRTGRAEPAGRAEATRRPAPPGRRQVRRRPRGAE